MTDPDAPPAFDRRTLRPLLAGAAVLTPVAFVFALVWLSGFDRRRSDRLEKMCRFTDAEFAQVLARADSPDPIIRARFLPLAASSVADMAGRGDVAGRGARVDAIALRLLASADSGDRCTAMTALGRLGWETHRDRAIALRADPDPDVQVCARSAVEMIDLLFLLPLQEVSRPLTPAEFARACDVVGGSSPHTDEPYIDALAIQAVETAAGRDAGHRRAALELLDRLAAHPADPHRQARATEARDRLRATP